MLAIIDTYKRSIILWLFIAYVNWYSKVRLWAAYAAFYYRNMVVKIKNVTHTTSQTTHCVKYNDSFVKYPIYTVQHLETGKEYHSNMPLPDALETIKELRMSPFIMLQYSHKDGEPVHFTLDRAYQIVGNKICALYMLHKINQSAALDVRDNAPFKLHIMDSNFNRVEVDLHRQYVLLTDCPAGYIIKDKG